MYAMNIQNDVIGLVLREHCKSKQMTDFIAWPSRCHDTICPFLRHLISKFCFIYIVTHIIYKKKKNADEKEEFVRIDIISLSKEVWAH